MNRSNVLITTLFLVIFSIQVNSQVVINEFMASNSSVITDPDNNNYSDWIELYNKGNSAVNLKGYFLTDNISRPDKYQIPVDAEIPAHGFLIIWADGDSTGLHASFKLTQIGEEIGLFSSSLDLVDSITYSTQYTDISYGRKTNGAATWGFFSEPTPGTSNNTTAYTGLVDNVPEFSLFGGINASPQQVSLSTPFGGTIRFTTDGSDPLSTSPAYSSPISINSTTIIRARVFKTNLIPGRIVTNSYFIDETLKSRGLPVFSIATNPENFWDPTIGIYVQNFKPDWEVPINIELFENDGSDRAAFNELAGTKINGLYSWQLPQKMLGVYFRKQYGISRLAYPLIFDRDRQGYRTFALRASGNDWSNTMFRDAMIQNSTPFNMNIDIMGYRPSILYVNGQYMGIHNIREKVEENYIVENHGLEEGTFDMVENEDYAETGDLTAYHDFKSLYSKDLSVQSNYDTVAAVADIDDFIDYIATEVYSGNYSIDHNVMAWKPKDTGKWKWIVMDLDRGFIDATQYKISYYINQNVWPLYRLMQNQGFKSKFGKRLADHLYTTFNPARMEKVIEERKQKIEQEMPYHIERWLGTTSSYGDAMPSMEYWYDEVNKLKVYADERPQIIIDDLQNYGFSASANLTLSVSPSNAGYITFNDLKVPGSTCTGPYIMDSPIELKAIDKPGYHFAGWTQPVPETIITKGDEWKYLDNGSDQGSAWHDTTYNDNSWQSGLAEFGYGEGDEQTIVSYGGNSNNKYITTYFRKSFQLTASDVANSTFSINLLYDDGAIVYINGKEVTRPNMPEGVIYYNTLAVTSISGSAETIYTNYPVDASFLKSGNNVLAVEMHQSAANSGDLSFDLELVVYKPQNGNYVSTNNKYTITLTADQSLIAVYESTGDCIIPETITTDLTLSKECSPYLSQGDITVDSGATLTIEPGVEIRMAEKGSMFVYGNIQAIGTETERILFTKDPMHQDGRWGAICLINCSEVSNFAYVTIEHASEGPLPIREIAAISAFHSDINLDHLIIEDIYHDPVLGRYSNIVMTNSSLHSEIAGTNLINVKYGYGRVENCTFRGDKYPDTDAIDYDDVEDGIIKNCKIYNNLGYNSDAIDIGEQATNIFIDSVLIINMSDKGISVGQQSTATVKNCVIVNCNLGFGVKDSSTIHIDHCTVYGTGKPVACFEKNPGEAGGNAFVRNSVLSNSYDTTFWIDKRSTGQIYYSISDNDALPGDATNLYGNPVFKDPTDYDFHFLSSSPCLTAGSDNGNPSPMGSLFNGFTGEPSLMFSYIFCNAYNLTDKSEFIGIFNPSSEPVDLKDYTITLGVEYKFKSYLIQPQETIYLVKDLSITPPNSYNGHAFQWHAGSLANEGETIRLVDNNGIVLDQVIYNHHSPWPDYNSSEAGVLSLISPDLDNHFGTSWELIDYSQIVSLHDNSLTEGIMIYPNPSTSIFNIDASGFAGQTATIYNIAGRMVTSIRLDNYGKANLQLPPGESGIYFLRLGSITKKIILIR
jgi:hypothetical protein